MATAEALNDSNSIKLFLDKELDFLDEQRSSNFIWIYAKDNLFYDEVLYLREKFFWLTIELYPTYEKIREIINEKIGVIL